jgi:ATP-dependent Clp protease ATP-binding subunit ClpX
LKYVSPQDLKSFGLIPELIGRMPVLTHLNPLDRETLISILTEPKNSIVKQYQKLFEYEEIELTIEKDVLEFIVDRAMEYKLGARGLRSIMEAIMIDAMFEMPSDKSVKKLNVDLAYAKQKFEKSEVRKLKVA